jgi:hypothetical protein
MRNKILIALSMLAGIAFAASSFTTHYNLEKSADGDTNWGSAYRSNMDTIDTQIYSASQTADNHIADPTSAHAATAISTAAGALVCTASLTAQAYLDCLDGQVGAITGGTVVTTNTVQTITAAKTFSALQTFTNGITLTGGTLTLPFASGLLHSDGSGVITSSLLVNADVDAAAGIVDTKLATIATAGKVSNSATTATSANTASAIVARDGSGDFTAGTITAALAGNASTATALASNPTDCGVGEFANAIAANGNLTCAVPTSIGDVVGPASSVDNELVLFNSTTGKLIKRASGNGAVSVSSGVVTQGTLSLANGGTGGTDAAVSGGIVFSDADSMEISAAGTSGQYLKSNGSSAPSFASFVAPTVQRFTSGSGTYTTAANVLYIKVRMIGGGGGGGGGGSASWGTGGNGGTVTFGGGGLASCTGGTGAQLAIVTGGTCTISSPAVTIATVTGASSSNGFTGTGFVAGSTGAGTLFGGGGSGCVSGSGSPAPAAVAFGAGGGGGCGSSISGNGGVGGAGGGYAEFIISSPSATYAYVIPAVASGGSAGTGGTAGGAGAIGYVEVTEYYQ